MARPSVTVVIPVWNEWHHTKNCLETLRPTLGIHDEVVIVDNGSEDGTAKSLKHYPWAKVITNEENLGFAKACNQGARVANGDIIIFLNNDTLVPARWIEALVAPFEDGRVVATGPRSNAVSGPQLVPDFNYSLSPMSSFRDWARDWRESHVGQTTETDRLVGFCLAVRGDTFAHVQGFDEGFEIGGYEDDDLCRRLGDYGKLLIAHESFVHHVGHATFDGNGLDWYDVQEQNGVYFREKHNMPKKIDNSKPLISACLIMKDEFNNLNDCLTSLNGLVDEVVIYDTGSTDGSIELARAAGAIVIEGFWDDDFSRARNIALDNCHGEWILWIDADERFDGDPLLWRQLLSTTMLPGFVLDILNLTDAGIHNLTHQAARLFRREMWHWEGRLHEQVVMLNHDAETELHPLQPGRLVHHGYLAAAMEAKNKAERNIRIAKLQSESGDGDEVEALTNLGRSLSMGNRHTEALEVYSQARELTTKSPIVRRALLRSGAYATLSAGRAEELFDWVDDLEEASNKTDTVRYLRGIAYTDTEQFEKAVEQLETLFEVKDEDGVQYPIWLRHVKLAISYAGLGRWSDAADTIAIAAVAESHEEAIWRLVVDSHYHANKDLGPLLARIPAHHLNQVFAQLIGALPEAADRALVGLLERDDSRANVMALAIRIAPRLNVERAFVWSQLLHEVQMGEYCPLVAIALDASRPTMDRIQAGAVAFAAFSDDRARVAISAIAGLAKPETFEVALSDLSSISPELLETFITGATTNPQRCVDMAKALLNLGASEEAAAVMLYGVEQSVSDEFTAQAQQWLQMHGFDQEALSLQN